MLNFFRQLAVGIREAWQRLSFNARIQIGLAAVLSLVFIVSIVVVAGQPQFVRLYSRLDPSEANEIIVWLSDNDIEYRLREGGQSIDVPIQNVQQARVGLVDIGLPQTQGVSEGFELFTNRDLMTNQWLQNVDFMRALQGELQRQLNQFEFVRKSFVFIREASEQLFVSEQKPSQASVSLDTTRQLTKREVKAILNIVSSFGGANLSPDNITLTLTDGTLLHSPVQDKFAALASGQFEAQVELENQREDKVRHAFRDIGVNAIIKVSAVMDWSSEDRTIKQVTEGSVVSSMDTSTTTLTSDGPPEGAPGAIANIPEGLGAPGSTSSSSETKELIENFDPSESLIRTVRQPGTVKKFRVSAFIEGNYKPILNDDGTDSGESTYEPLTQVQIANYTTFISNAVGQGDESNEIAVFDQPFKIDRLAAAAIPLSALTSPWWRNRVVQLGVQGLLILMTFFMIRVFTRRALVLPTVEEEELVEIPAATAEDMRRKEIAAEVERLAQEEPEVVAALLRSWMGSDEYY